ncbi:MAG: polyprenol monophosphomannose synthase [Deltaproteobacteria bacterium]|nr:polyprenol monophosphomannose synthase [Deltaproteobacteria bacterium]
MRKIIVIPTYNEKENLERIVAAVLAVDAETEVLVVDDNSPDGTGAIADTMAASEPRVHVLHRRGKEGLGPAYRAGFRRALDLGADLIVQMDADFSHPPASLPTFFALAQDYDVVLGSRYIDGITVVNWPMGRLMLSYFGNVYVKIVLGRMPVMDATGGFKCWRRATLEAIPLDEVRANGYGFQIEMTYRAWRAGFRIKETPIIFTDRRVGTSKMHISIAVEALLMVWSLRLQSLLGRIGERRALPDRSA